MSCHHQRVQTSHEWCQHPWSIEKHLSSCTTYEFSSISWIQFLSMSTSFTKRMSIYRFKVILGESLMNRFSFWKQKLTSEEPQLASQLPQALTLFTMGFFGLCGHGGTNWLPQKSLKTNNDLVCFFGLCHVMWLSRHFYDHPCILCKLDI